MDVYLILPCLYFSFHFENYPCCLKILNLPLLLHRRNTDLTELVYVLSNVIKYQLKDYIIFRKREYSMAIPRDKN